MTQRVFDDLKKEVCRICDNFGYDCSFKHDCYIYVYARLNSHGRQYISSSLFERLFLIPEIVFYSVNIDDYDRMFAFFYVKDLSI